MPLQNRVTPFGEIVATPERGAFMGNRGGRLHDPATQTLLPRRWVSRQWIACACQFNGRQRTVMGPRTYTELFFLDEATALAAGHRPCFECRRRDYLAFRDAWARAHGGPLPKAADMDRVLQAERLDGKAKRLHPLPAPLAALPDGTMVAAGAEAFVLAAGSTFRWSPRGYAPARPVGEVALLTPPAIVASLAAGFRAAIDATAHRNPSTDTVVLVQAARR